MASDDGSEDALLQQTRDAESAEPIPFLPSVPVHLARHLYVSHFLSTWNSRLFEFGSVLFLASIYPDTLLPMSVYALVRSAAAIVFSQAMGSWIDRGNRLLVVQISIVGQRLAVTASCGIFWALQQQQNDVASYSKTGLFMATVVLACVEKLCSVVNLVSVERDWVSESDVGSSS
jgi:solute carrier family 40 (iron-regulated transporter), member 1